MTVQTEMTLTEAAASIRDGRVTATGLTTACLARIEATDGLIGAFASVQADQALEAAAALDSAALDGAAQGGAAPHGPLHGVPVALKDLFFTDGVATEANCDALTGFTPDYDAVVVQRLRSAGAVIIGKTNTHELAFGVSCPDSRNPWDAGRMTGGSSGGSAAAVAAGHVFGALGTDTGGSVRIPSNYCGTTGIKTTRGVVPRHGVHLLSWTYDTVGPMARTAADCRLLLEVIAGHSSLDPYSARTPMSAARPPGELVLGVPGHSFFAGIDTDPEVRAVMDEAVAVLTTIVAKVIHADVPHTAEHGDAGSAIVFAEAAALLAETRANSNERIGEEPRAILEAGAQLSGTDVVQAQATRMAFERAYLDVFDEQGVDVLVAPVNPNQVLPHGIVDLDGVPLIPATTQFTFPINGAGLPSIALPGGFASDGLPIGFQLIGRPYSDLTLAAIGEAFQAATAHHRARPEVG